MKKLLLLTLALVGLTACQSAPRIPTQPTNSATLDLATGNITQIDNSGQSQSAAGNSRVANIDSGVAVEFAKKSDPGQELAWFDITRAAEDQPDVAIDLALANEHKSAVENLKAITAGGNPTVAALNLATEALKVVKTKIEAREREKAARGKADTSAFRATAFLQGPDAVKSVALMAGTMGAAVANGNQNRANYQSNINSSQIDTSNTNDWNGAATILKHQLELAKINLQYELAKKDNNTPAPKPPVVKPVEPDEVDDDTPGEAPTSSVEYDKLPKKNFIYKTRLDKTNPVTRQDAAILIPKDRPAPVSIDGIGHEIVENYLSKSEDRWLLRTKGPLTSSAATLTVTYKDGSKETFKIKALNSRTEYAPGAYKKASTGPVDPPPSGGNTSAAPAGGKTHELTSIGLLLRADVAATVSHVIVIEDAEFNRENPPKIAATRIGNTWTTGKPLSQHRAAVYQVWFATPPPAPVTYHPDFLGKGPVGHVTQAGLWNPDTIR